MREGILSTPKVTSNMFIDLRRKQLIMNEKKSKKNVVRKYWSKAKFQRMFLIDRKNKGYVN